MVPLSALRLVDHLRPGDTVAWAQGNGEPAALTRLLKEQRHELSDVRCLVGFQATGTFGPDEADVLSFASYCGTGRNQELADAGVLEILPIPYSLLPQAMRTRRLPVDVVLAQVTPPDAQGRYTVGLAADYIISAIEQARAVIAQVNTRLPRVACSTTFVRSDLDVVVEHDDDVLECRPSEGTDVIHALAQRAAELVPDEATVQVGLGSAPSAVAAYLRDHRDLGVHSGLITDAVGELIRHGAVTNRRKGPDAGHTVTGVLAGSRSLLDVVDANPTVRLHRTEYTHDPAVLSSLHRLTSINSALEVDLTGQVNAEAMGGHYLGAVGGGAEFTRAASRADDGVPIIVLPARARGRSRIVGSLGGPVSISRSDVGYVVTEYGVADLRGASIEQRCERVIAIAHPDDRAGLAADAEVQLRTRRRGRVKVEAR